MVMFLLRQWRRGVGGGWGGVGVVMTTTSFTS